MKAAEARPDDQEWTPEKPTRIAAKRRQPIHSPSSGPAKRRDDKGRQEEEIVTFWSS